MRHLLFVAPVLIAAMVVVGSMQAAAVADPGTSVTLKAAPPTVEFGQPVRLSGQISPPSGRQTVLVRYEDGEHAGVSWRSKPATPPLPALRSGSTGVFVQLLEKRLMELHYRVYAQDPSFDYRDADSVLAFHKEQRMPLSTSVDQQTWWALANPKRPVIRGPKTGTHFEVDLTKQVLLYVVDGQVDGILHVSTGKPSTPTVTGTFHVWTKQPGTNQEGMYNSSFFDGNRALHGYPDVPSYAASHGCVRIPFWNALWVYDRAPIGIEVLVYNS